MINNWSLCTTLCLLFFCTEFCYSQTYTLFGKVTNVETGEGISFCNVFFEGTSTGVYTDIDGIYELKCEQIKDSLTASIIGYQSLAMPLSPTPSQALNFQLHPSTLTLTTAVVIAGENPANAIVNQIIKNKSKNQIIQLPYYQYESYAKVEIDLKNIRNNSPKIKWLKPLDFIYENVDSTSEEHPFLPIFINETITDICQENDKLSQNLKAQKASGIENKTMIQYVDEFQSNYSVYDNWIELFDKPFASPFAKQGHHYYEYYLLDSLESDGQKLYHLKFKPKRNQENTFKGNFWVVDKNFAIQKVEMDMSADANINFVEQLSIEQLFEYKDGWWLPSKQQTVAHFDSPVPKTPKMIGRRTVSNKDFILEKSAISMRFQIPSQKHLESIKQNDNYWNAARHEALSASEAGIYTMIDSLHKTPQFRVINEIIDVALGGTKAIGPVEIGPYFSLFSNNILEGYRFKFGAWTSQKFSKKIRFGGFAAYGLRDQQWKYGGDVKWIIAQEPRVVLGASYKNDNDLNTDNDFEVGEGNMLSSLLRRDIVQKLVLEKKAKLYFEKYWETGWYSRLSLLHHDMNPANHLNGQSQGFNYAFLPKEGSNTEIDSTVTTSEISFKVRYAYREKFIDKGFTRRSLGSRYPIISLAYARGLKGVLNSEYNYHKINFSINHALRIRPIGELHYSINSGKTIGRVPFLLTEIHRGNETYFLMSTTFNTMNKYEFASDTYLSWKLEHHFDGFILNKIPLLRKLNWRAVATFKGVWGIMSDENLEANRLNVFTPDRPDYIGFRSPSQKPFMETGIGIENIFKIIRVDALWRLNYLDNPEALPFVVKVGIDMRF